MASTNKSAVSFVFSGNLSITSEKLTGKNYMDWQAVCRDVVLWSSLSDHPSKRQVILLKPSVSVEERRCTLRVSLSSNSNEFPNVWTLRLVRDLLRWDPVSLLLRDSCKEPLLSAINPQSWLQVERGKLTKLAPQSPSSIESLIKVPEPPILPLYKPVDYVKVLAQIHEDLESCLPTERSNLYLLQYQVFKGLREAKLMRRSLRSAWLKSSTVYEKLVFGAWLKYEKQGEEIISDLLSSCGKCAKEFGAIDIPSEFPVHETPDMLNDTLVPRVVSFQIGDEKITCDRRMIAGLSAPFHAMLNGIIYEDIDLSENNISPSGMRAISDYSKTGILSEVPPSLLLEILVFANRFCCESLKDACDKKLASLVSSRQDAVELMEFALEQNSPVLAASCLQVFLHELPDSLDDKQRSGQAKKVDYGGARVVFSLFFVDGGCHGFRSFLRQSSSFLKAVGRLCCNQPAENGCFSSIWMRRLFRKEYDQAEKLFEAALSEGHVYSVVGLARLSHIKGHKDWCYEKITSVISSHTPLGWMYQERSLYCDGDERWEELERATELDPTLTYPYMYRAASLMRKQDVQSALAEINRVLGFKLALECLELRFCFYLALEDYQSALCDVQAILTLCPDYRMFDGRVAASQPVSLSASMLRIGRQQIVGCSFTIDGL
ncbi:hypothetical protein DH2020_024885 [Rehmannia glutinosa]|uniref:BTB domain-containing protein n=1 Tax=Rehmannia glutinosa TaxID=99300 RepID=A0ABR0W152_REHGL